MKDRLRLERLLLLRNAAGDWGPDFLSDGFLSDDVILDGPDFRALTGISRPTEWRMHKAGELPPRVQFTATRYGYRVGHIRRWIAARTERPPLNNEVAQGGANTLGHEATHEGKRCERAVPSPARGGV